MSELFDSANVYANRGPKDPPKRVRAKAVAVKKKMSDISGAVTSYEATITIENSDNLRDISGLTTATIGQCTTTGEPITIVKTEPDMFSFEITGNTNDLPTGETATVTLAFALSTKVEGGTQENVPYSLEE